MKNFSKMTFRLLASMAIFCAASFKTNAQQLSVNIQKTDVLCNGQSSGSATATVSGGTAPYSFLWSNGATTASISGLSAGNYQLTVTDAAAMSASSSTLVNQPPQLGTFCFAQVQICELVPDGVATTVPFGGTIPYSYSWSNGSTGPQITGLAQGTYTTTVTDKNGCTATCSTFVDLWNEGLWVTAVVDEPAKCPSDTGGKAHLSVMSGTAPYTYTWSNGATTPAIENLSAGSYQFTVTDVNGCSFSKSVQISLQQNNLPAVNLPGPFCLHEKTEFSTANDTILQQYSNKRWTLNNPLDSIISGQGTLAIRVKWGAPGLKRVNLEFWNDFNACAGSQLFECKVDQCTDLSVSIQKTDVLCNGQSNGSATANVGGGAAPYTFLWSTGDTTASVSGLPAGSYQVTVTDADSSATSDSISVLQPPTLGLTCFGQSQLCEIAPDGSATAIAYDGTPPYNYVWNNGQSGWQITGLVGGLYTATVTDANGCTTSSSAEVNFWNQGIWFLVDVDEAAKCPSGTGGKAHVDQMSGTAPHTFLWSTGDTTQSVENLSAGKYQVTVADVNGCSQTQTVEIPLQQTVLPPIEINDPSCIGEQRTFSLSDAPQQNYEHKLWTLDHPLDSIVEGQGTLTVRVKWGIAGQKKLNLKLWNDANQCLENQVFNHVVDICVGTEEGAAENWKITPNPFSDFIEIIAPDGLQTIENLTFSDASGRLVFERAGIFSVEKIETSRLPAGIYFLKMKTPRGLKFLKMVKN